MHLICVQSRLSGSVDIPGSKSHTIRAVTLCSLAAGESTIREPLTSADTVAAVDTFRALGADIQVEPNVWRVRGTRGELSTPENFIDVKNSGTTLRLAVGAASLLREGHGRLHR
jgi:3-phosphoshikimate 1-carboxyvinyltransferase